MTRVAIMSKKWTETRLHGSQRHCYWLRNWRLGSRDRYTQVKTCYLVAAMGLQAIWSFLLALMDAYAVVRKKVLHNPALVSLYLVGDWVSATLSLAAACSSAGIIVLYFHDLGHCYFGEKCRSYQISVGFAFLSWIPTSISSLIMLWLLAGG
ncbi:CASP-like protein [Medicago truncatula]|uniref:CASP-like protein n=1 Tax=Medicago truncatula TaxID=3880 RepID=A0A072VM59_MEDTR|nr:CASP-like protein [Medicago truncatula]